ncbi:MAG: protein kinase [Thermoanaerobaculia bacterium]
MTGRKIGPYEVVEKLGEGGMGEVYRATDSKLKREVAIKVLPAAFTNDPERLARFEREAQLLAQLHHPNIASIFGLEESDGERALVMELVEGPTLAERLADGPLALAEALPIARQIAEALEEAHEKGIVHRDLKPQNVKVTADGKVKVLDFGLAKAMDPESGSGGSVTASPTLMNSPTLTAAGTQLGVILGTAAYMAPEQARGGIADRRADVWAFGVVLFEMLTGKSLFAADTVPDTLARVLTREPDVAELPPEVPAAVRTLVRRCLVRQPRNRLHSIADARIAIDDVLEGRSDESPVLLPVVPPAPAGAAGSRAWIAWAVAGMALLALLASRILRDGGDAGGVSLAEASIRILVTAGVSTDPSVSPDGRTLAFVSERDGRDRVWIKDLASGSESVLGRDPSWLPRFSPDGTSVLFLTQEGDRVDIYRISLATREERLVARNGIDADWSPDGRRVLFIRGDIENFRSGRELVEIDLASGTETLLHTDPTGALFEPHWSPDGRRIAIQSYGPQTGTDDRLLILDPGGRQVREIPMQFEGRPGTRIRGAVWLDVHRLALLLLDLGEQVSNSGRIAVCDVDTGRLRSLQPLAAVGWGLTVAGQDSLVVSTGSSDQNLYESHRIEGGWSPVEARTEGPFVDRQPVYSPDGRWLVFTSSRSGNLDVWRRDRQSGELQRLTDDKADDWDPALSPDGKRLLFSSNRSGRFQIWIADADGSSARQVTDFENAQNPTMTPDGEWIFFVRQGSVGENGVWKVRVDGSDASPIVKGNLLVPETSPDGRFVAARTFDGHPLLRVATSGYLENVDLGPSDRYRWSVESGKTFLWAIGILSESREIRRYSFDPWTGRVGQPETVLPADVVRSAETLGVARDGSAVAFSRAASRRAQLLRIDGITGLR